MHSSRTFPDKLKIQNMKKKIVAALNLKKELISDPITKLFGVSEYEVSVRHLKIEQQAGMRVHSGLFAYRIDLDRAEKK